MKISLTVTDLWSVQECLEKINQRSITRKLRKGEQSLCLNLINIPLKLHEDMPNGYCIMEHTRRIVYGQMDGQTAPRYNTSVFFKWAYKNRSMFFRLSEAGYKQQTDELILCQQIQILKIYKCILISSSFRRLQATT